ncbi:erythronate-4-phosphate dehydrogenase [Marinobacterium nitratireducens]|uniref:Erythronate-4-phosphate dehydrogenase n=1 Tax=Marinobacterium nitratireducens TaxID=518897 RepID=A0A917ZEM1_9GAMM|nr:4-phosphoerythronate dehydrogenase PdxB [Marinobacterium nitratireducens]GGO81112.1 erythronate-4-phosphate dehydrogenase [Marinobacterium nitratireducens]
MKHRTLNIVADENIPQLEALFGPLGSIRRLPGRDMSPDALVDADLLLVRSITRVDRALLEGSRVRFVGTATIGTDHVDLDYLAGRGIAFSSAPGCNADAVVEFVLTVLYQLASEQGFSLRDKTLGIIGVGNVGGRLQQRLERLGVRLLLNDPPRAAASPEGFVTLDELLSQADIVSMHTPLISDGPYPTRHLLGSLQLAQLKRGAILLNAGRGGAIDNRALLDVARRRQDLTLVLDVWEHEPVVDPELAQRVRFCSPHIAGYSLDGKIRGTYMLYQAVRRLFGIGDAVAFESCVPEATIRMVDVSAQVEPLELMRLLYDPFRDDRELRATLGLPEAERGQAFDRLRKNYPVRREFATLKVRGDLDESRARELAALGFSVELA